MASQGLSQHEIHQANEIASQAVELAGQARLDKMREHLTFVIRTDGFTSRIDDRFNASPDRLSSEEIVQTITVNKRAFRWRLRVACPRCSTAVKNRLRPCPAKVLGYRALWN
ncbi:MAG: hypothetical protein ETSY2_35820 [Candidatus Entotheonella gemina]|uniref:Uncharacterized protein n=1 Tax=Candidatus Entotheonella gemina TaxID=1429439 RepID=W4LWK8_9BACT|nr:MAG: hypothetical protein ETSY2_35820 [Candidatus Entotheonella gemina]